MSYGTLEYWERRALQADRECANQRREIEALWARLVAVETIAAEHTTSSSPQSGSSTLRPIAATTLHWLANPSQRAANNGADLEAQRPLFQET